MAQSRGQGTGRRAAWWLYCLVLSLSRIAQNAAATRIDGLDELYYSWELASIHGECRPPHGVLEKCCLGALSGGGDNHWSEGNQKRCWNAPYRSSDIFKPYHNSSTAIDTIVDGLVKGNKTLAMTGDSLMHQMRAGFECEVARHGKHSIRKAGVESIKLEHWRNGVNWIGWFDIDGAPNRLTAYGQYRMHTVNEKVILNFGLHWGTNDDEYLTIQILCSYHSRLFLLPRIYV